MSEEIELNEGDLLVPAPEDFTLFDLVEGVEYPKTTETVMMDEKAAYELIHLVEDIKRYRAEAEELSDEVLEEYRSQVEKLQADIEASKVTFHLTGVSDDLIGSAGEIAEAKFEGLKKQIKGADGLIQKVLPQAEKVNFMRYLSAVTQSMHIEKVVRHKDGAVRVSPSPDEVAHLMGNAPSAAKAALVAAINSLRVKAADYEANLDEGFFQKS